MKTLITLHHPNHLEKILVYTDGILVGNDRFGTRLTHSFSTDELMDLAHQTKALDKAFFILANQMMTDDELDQFSHWIDRLQIEVIDGIVVADLGAIILLKEKGFSNKVIYNPETLITNHYDFNFLSNLDIQGVYAAKEITLEDIKLLGKDKSLALFMTGHGHLNMFYSKRQLIKNYSEYTGISHPLHQAYDLKLIEEKRSDEPYPILEDFAGTHVFRSKVLSSFDVYDELMKTIDYFVIDTIFKDDDYGVWVAKMYKDKSTELKKTLQETYKELWDDGFFYKKTIYKGKDIEK